MKDMTDIFIVEAGSLKIYQNMLHGMQIQKE